MTERHRHLDQVTSEPSDERLRQLMAGNDQLRGIIAVMETEKARAETALREALSEIRSRESSEMSLRQRIGQIEQEIRSFADRYLQIAEQNANLANLYVASCQLHGTFERQAVLDAIKEIVINLIGSEELAVYEMSTDGRELLLIDSHGVDTGPLSSVPVGSGLIGSVAGSGRAYVIPNGHDEASNDAPLTAAIPLKVEGRLVGLLAIFHLLPQKDSLQPIDLELFDLLASHGANALFWTGAFERAKLRGDAA